MNRHVILIPSLALAAVLLVGCPENGGSPPADASCDLAVSVGTGNADDYVPLVDGDEAEVILGFQGFRMLQVTLRVEGTGEPRADVSGYVTIEESGVEVAQLPRTTAMIEGPDGARYAEGFLVFFNDTPVSEIVGREGELELIARSGGCVGGTRVALAMVDDDSCVDWDLEIPDAGILDGGIPDGAVACGEGM